MSASKSHLHSNSTIARQHDQIESLIEALSSRFETEKIASRNLVSLLNSLAAHLEMHFELEEENEYFGFVLKESPHLSERVDQLLHQHEVLKTEVDHLVSMARQALDDNAEVAELATKYEDFRKMLLEHEHAEIELLQESYSRDIGSKD